MTITEGAMETNERERRRYAQGTGRVAPRPQAIPGGHVIPAKAGTYWRRRLRASGNLPYANATP